MPIQPGKRTFTEDELIYYAKSPDYCSPDDKTGSVGTRGRYVATTSSSARIVTRIFFSIADSDTSTQFSLLLSLNRSCKSSRVCVRTRKHTRKESTLSITRECKLMCDGCVLQAV